jgi:uncharacterized RDD family membrane protein YckC
VEPERLENAELAASKVAANVFRHAAEVARIRAWTEDDRFVCEIDDTGRGIHAASVPPPCSSTIAPSGSCAGVRGPSARSTPGSRRARSRAIDAAVTIVLFTSGVGIAALVASLVGTLRPAWRAGLLLTFGLMLVAGTYFVTFWIAAGQTPGMRLLRLRVHARDGRAPSIGRSLVRLIGLVLSIVPLFAGFLQVLFTERRRGLPDFLAGTVVLYDDRRPRRVWISTGS